MFSRHTDTILIAEPNQVLRQLEYRALSPTYQIVQTSSAEEAVRTAGRHETEIDLLLTEVRLPHIDGWQLTELLKLDYPNLKVVYLSNSIDAEIRARTRSSVVIVLEKNRFRAGCLRQAVRDVLEGRQKNRVAAKAVTDSFVSLLRRGWRKLPWLHANASDMN
jgi:two-component system cell cycle sensor histidine kinase/response regulator CckA